MPMPTKGLNLWLTEKLSEGEVYKYLISKSIYERNTKYHSIHFVEFVERGTAFILDNKLQFTAADEFMYYEPLVHIPLIQMQNPANVLILGYGCGSSIREVLKWKSLKSVTVVETDKELVAAGIKNLSNIHKNSHKNSKVKIYFHEVDKFIKFEEKKYDVIICDISSNYKEKNTDQFSEEFFIDCNYLLEKNGIMVCQTGDVNVTNQRQFNSNVKFFSAIFSSVHFYATWIPSTCKNMSFVLLSKNLKIKCLPVAEVEQLLKTQILGDLKFITGSCYYGLLHPPKYMQPVKIAI